MSGRRVPSGRLDAEIHVRVEPGAVPELVLTTYRQSPANFAAGFVESGEAPRVALQFVPHLLEQIRAEYESALTTDATASGR